MKNKFTKIAAGLLAAAILTIEFLSPIANASKIEIEAGQEDVFNELEEAAKVNVAMNTLWKCLRSDYYTPSTNRAAISGKDVAKGKIFVFPGLAYEVDIGTSLWMENLVQANGGDDGAIYCQQDKGDNLLNIVTKKILGVEYTDILCYPDGRGRIYYRSDLSTDSDCQHFNDKGAMYKRFDDWETGLRDFYNNWRATAGNKYLPTYDEIGNYNNVDGYFNYLLDFNKYCGYDGTPSRTKGANESAYPITTFEKSTTQIVFKTRYYHLSSDKSWQRPLSTDNPVTTCSGLLQRIEVLKDTWNEAVRVDKREYGYSSIILANLEDACKNLKTADGENAYDALRRELEAIRDNTSGNATEEDIAKAKENLATLNSITDYVVSSGDEFDEDGKIYKCVDIEGLKITLNEYHPPSETIGEEPSGGEQEASCFDGTGVVGWIVCPIIEFLGDFIQGVYEAFIVPFLQLDVELFKSDSPVYAVWDNLRNVANLGFVIFFIVVIFSQLTGVGIDNYGIKKILPKLIMGAILINLSFIICQLAVDLSNILGYSIENILDSWMPTAGQLNITRTHGAGTVIGSIALDGALLICIVRFLVLPAVLAIGPEIWVAVLLVVITVAIAILFCFILLTIRKSFAVLLVIVSPLAFMCYILPNTKGLFDKWFKTFKSVLLAFPICSAMIYGGQFVGRVLVQAAANNGGHAHFSVALSGAVISIIPIFLIPTVLRHSMGAIGAMMGRLQGGLTHAARFHAGNSGWAQEKKMQGIQYRNARRAGYRASFRNGEVLMKNGKPISRGEATSNRLLDRAGAAIYRARSDGALSKIPLVGVNAHDRNMARGRMLADLSKTGGQYADDASFAQTFTDTKFNQSVTDFMASAEYSSFANKDLDTQRKILSGASVEGFGELNATKRVAYARALANGTGKQKKALSKMIENGDISASDEGGSRIFNDSSIRNAITDKGRPLSSTYMEEVAKGNTNADFKTWIGSEAGTKAIQQLARDTDKPEDLAALDADTFQRVISATQDGGELKADHSNAIISDDLIQRTLDNPNISSKLKSDSVNEDGETVLGHISRAQETRGITPSKAPQNNPSNANGELNVRQDSAPKQEVKLVGRQAYYHKTTGEKVRGYQFSDGRVMIVGKDGKKQVMNQNDYVIVNQNPRDKAKDNPPPSGEKA